MKIYGILMLALGLLLTTPAKAASRASAKASSIEAAAALDDGLFPTSPLLEKKVRFWEMIFNDYTSDQLVIHDLATPDIVIGVEDFSRGDDSNGMMKAYNKAIKDFAERGESAKAISALHGRILKAYKRDDDAYNRLINGRAELRGQIGLKDIFLNAAQTAQLYLPHMEKIFKQNGLPKELTRIPFVESMFNVKAKSKVGASGIWQLMPSAARPYILVNKKRDERNQPLRATHAAAQILKSNYAKLQSWPLAITGYNHGANGVKRGCDRLGTTNLGDLILSYKSPSFGFASQNFYAEFLAASRSYAKWQNRRMATAQK